MPTVRRQTTARKNPDAPNVLVHPPVPQRSHHNVFLEDGSNVVDRLCNIKDQIAVAEDAAGNENCVVGMGSPLSNHLRLIEAEVERLIVELDS